MFTTKEQIMFGAATSGGSLGQRLQALSYEPCHDHYKECLHHAWRLDLWRRLRGEATDLLSLDEVAKRWHVCPKVVRGFVVVPLSLIVGSVGRTRDFTRDFRPRAHADGTRWIEMDRLVARGMALPPVQLYKLEQLYFVLNGHHRVSVARSNGILEIDAHVVELAGATVQTAPAEQQRTQGRRELPTPPVPLSDRKSDGQDAIQQT